MCCVCITHVIEVCGVSGELKTTARWIRDVVTAHPEYKQDSVVSEGIAYDLLVRCLKVIVCLPPVRCLGVIVYPMSGV